MTMNRRPDQPDHPEHVLVDSITFEFLNQTSTTTPPRADLRYDTADPFAVTMAFHTGWQDVRWTFARELLLEGLYEPTGDGDVHVWPCLSSTGVAVVIVELASTEGEVLLQLSSRAVHQFVTRTMSVVPVGDESRFVDLDEALSRMLGS